MSLAGAWRLYRGHLAVATVTLVGLVAMAMLVVMGVSNPEPPGFAPTSLEARPAFGRLVGPVVVTVDASASDRWRFFSFRDGVVREEPEKVDWDLAFQRFQIIVNGGAGFAGSGGIVDLGDVPFDQVDTVPDTGYVANEAGSDTVNAAVEDWYDYSYLSHLLTPKSNVYAVRTSDGHYAKVQFVGYYCPQAVPGCITFRYVYQGGGGTSLLPKSPDGRTQSSPGELPSVVE